MTETIKHRKRNLHDEESDGKMQRKKKEKPQATLQATSGQKRKGKRTKTMATESISIDGKLHKKRKPIAGSNETKRKAEEISRASVEDEANHPKRKGKSKKSNKKKKMDVTSTIEIEGSSEKINETEEEEDLYYISSEDEDCSKGMKKWVTNYYESRPGLDELQKQIDDFMTAHEERLEQERQSREAKAAEGGWTVVVHHKGRKKTTEAESGIAVGSVSQAALEDKVAKKKQSEPVAHGFYRFQKRDAQRNEILALQSKFEQDKKRIQQLRAARKFKPY